MKRQPMVQLIAVKQTVAAAAKHAQVGADMQVDSQRPFWSQHWVHPCLLSRCNENFYKKYLKCFEEDYLIGFDQMDHSVNYSFSLNNMENPCKLFIKLNKYTTHLR